MVDVLTAVIVRAQTALYDLREREEGQDLVEYVVLIALIAIALLAAFIFFKDSIATVFSKIGNFLNDKVPAV
jgi:Flp pilus assembly pilin Flp